MSNLNDQDYLYFAARNGHVTFISHDGILRETEKATCFKVCDDFLWFPDAALKQLEDETFEVASWFKFSNDAAFAIFSKHVCNL